MKCALPVMGWDQVQGFPCLALRVPWDRFQVTVYENRYGKWMEHNNVEQTNELHHHYCCVELHFK